MKRHNNLFEKICSKENIIAAEKIARKDKSKQHGVKRFAKDPERYVQLIHEMLINKTYKTSPYTHATIYEPKERQIAKLPYAPDRIVHHAIMNIMEPLFRSWFTADTFSCIKGRGIHGLMYKLKDSLVKVEQTTYYLQLDIRKFYPEVKNDILLRLLRRKIKDIELLRLLEEIINSAPGLPIGNYLSQYFANFYLTPLDHYIKQDLGAKYYFRYADDIVILAKTSTELHTMLRKIAIFLKDVLGLDVKGNWAIRPVQKCGIDVVGYVFRHTHILLRKRTKKSYARMLKKRPNRASIASYKGWTDHANCKNLNKTLLTDEIIQRLKLNTTKKIVRRSKDRYNGPVQQRNSSTGLFHNEIKIQQHRPREVHVHPNRGRW